jgi:hypothetical protein
MKDLSQIDKKISKIEAFKAFLEKAIKEYKKHLRELNKIEKHLVNDGLIDLFAFERLKLKYYELLHELKESGKIKKKNLFDFLIFVKKPKKEIFIKYEKDLQKSEEKMDKIEKKITKYKYKRHF